MLFGQMPPLPQWPAWPWPAPASAPLSPGDWLNRFGPYRLQPYGFTPMMPPSPWPLAPPAPTPPTSRPPTMDRHRGWGGRFGGNR
jgi:hypothetical protein